MAGEIAFFNRADAARIGSAVNQVEGFTTDSTGRRVRYGASTQTLYARLTTKVTDGWEWDEVYPHRETSGSITWTTVPTVTRKGRNSPEANTEKLLAIELVAGDGSAGAIVMLSRVFVEKGSGSSATVETGFVIFTKQKAVQVKCVDDYGRADSKVRVKMLVSGSPTGDPFDVSIIHHTETNDLFYVYPLAGGTGGVGYVQFGYPARRGQFTSLLVMDTSGGPQSIDFAYSKGHP